MKKAELKRLMQKYLVFENDIDYLCEFCEAVLQERAKETRNEYPYAYNTIKRYEDAAYEVYDLIDYINEVMEGEE